MQGLNDAKGQRFVCVNANGDEIHGTPDMLHMSFAQDKAGIKLTLIYTKEWYIYEDNRSDRPYSIDKDEICLNVFGSCDEGGWKSLGREDSYKIISLSDCSAFFVDYIYEKKEGEILDKQITQRCEVSKEEFVGLIKQHRVKKL